MLNSDIEITMKGGETLKAIWYMGQSSYLDGIGEDEFIGKQGLRFTAEIRYYQYNDYNNLVVWANLNPEEINSITIDHTKIFQAK